MTFISVLREAGFKKMPWDKCPQGFQQSNYPCYFHEERNIWVEVYLSDKPPYCQVHGKGIGSGYHGRCTDDPKELKSIIK